ncbi:hypothetical protein, partial [Rubrivivax gelatinosus]|uniref:hypothetical protein n=1 Tax=Rubrivivax gelatinosus TaxID=28068 RepID=UPI001ED9154E
MSGDLVAHVGQEVALGARGGLGGLAGGDQRAFGLAPRADVAQHELNALGAAVAAPCQDGEAG